MSPTASSSKKQLPFYLQAPLTLVASLKREGRLAFASQSIAFSNEMPQSSFAVAEPLPTSDNGERLKPAMASGHLAVLGVRHQQANVFWRGKLSFTPEESQAFIAHIHLLARQQPEVSGGLQTLLVLHTCNRSEWYVVAEDTHQATRWLTTQLIHHKQIASEEHETLERLMFQAHQMEAVFHLCRVASGLDSLVIGEDQILGQVRDAWLGAKAHHHMDDILEKTFQLALEVGKTVRTEIGMSRRSHSIADAMFQLACTHALQQETSLRQMPIIVLGAGKMASIILGRIAQLHRDSASVRCPVWVIHRHPQRVAYLKDKYPFLTLQPWDGLSTVLAESTHAHGSAVVFVATGAPHPVLHLKHLEGCPVDSITMYDLALPRNTHPELDHASQGKVYHLDHLGDVYRQFTESQTEMQARALVVIHQAWERYEQWWLLRPYQRSFKPWVQLIRLLAKGYLAHPSSPELTEAVQHMKAFMQEALPTEEAPLETYLLAGQAHIESLERLLQHDKALCQHPVSMTARHPSKPYTSKSWCAAFAHHMLGTLKALCLYHAKASTPSQTHEWKKRLYAQVIAPWVTSQSAWSPEASLQHGLQHWQGLWLSQQGDPSHTQEAVMTETPWLPTHTETLSKCPFARTLAFAVAMQSYIGTYVHQRVKPLQRGS
ncbi:MAG: hypothetical protein ACKO37_09870 [Vampirovibrionales bacterium]